MAGNDPISRLAQQVGERLQDASHAPEEIQRSVQNVMRGAFDRMELVTREDFDILMDVLQRTRSRVEALEKQVARLEASLDEPSTVPASPAMVAADTVAAPAEGAPAATAPGTTPPASEDAGGGEVSDSKPTASGKKTKSDTGSAARQDDSQKKQ